MEILAAPRVLVRLQTYLNLVYLLLAFPLGLAYFLFLTVGLAAGFALILTLVGIPILLLVHLAAWALMRLERELAIRLLHEKVPPLLPVDPGGPAWRRLVGRAADPSIWTGMFFLLAKLPLGLASLLLTAALLGTSVALAAAPVVHLAAAIPVGPWTVDTLGESLLVAPFGILLGILSLHVLNYAASLSGRIARLMLGARWWEAEATQDPPPDPAERRSEPLPGAQRRAPPGMDPADAGNEPASDVECTDCGTDPRERGE